MASVPVGRRNLFSERRRALIGVAGVAVALLMVLALDGIFAGAMRQVTRYIDTSSADVFVSQSGVRNMHMTSSSIPLSALDQVRGVDGVSWADPILYETNALKTSGGRELSYIIGYVPVGKGGPVRLTKGSEPGTGEIVLDERAASKLGLGLGDEVTAIGRTWKVSGLTSGLTNLVNTISFVRFDDFAAARGLPDTASYFLVGSRGPAADTAKRIEEATGLTALSRERFAGEEAKLVRDMSTEIMAIMTLAAFLIALAVIGLTLYADTVSRLREVGVMKALGARTRKLSAIVLSQAVWMIGASLAMAALLAFGLGFTTGRIAPNITVAITAASFFRVAVGAAVIGLIGAVAPLVKVSRVDPASVFRKP